MYFVDREQIEKTLVFLEKEIEIFQQINDLDDTFQKATLERVAHMMLDSVLDVGNMMIDGFIMRDPGSYEDIIDILIDEKVIPEEEEAIYKSFIELRKDIVTDYVNVDQQKIANTLLKSTPALKEFSTYIRSYLKNELGVANAFLKE